MKPEDKARREIDDLLSYCGWIIQEREQSNLSAGRGVAIREVPLQKPHGTVDYLLFVDGKAIGTVEAKPHGTTLRGVELQSAKYVAGLPPELPRWRSPLPFAFESTGIETQFTNTLEPDACSRSVFAFYRPESLVALVQTAPVFRNRLRSLPPLITDNLWPPQTKAIARLEESLAANRPRALIQMATGSGKTFMAVNSVYRLVKFAGARRVLFLVDRANLGRQALKEFQRFVTPDDGRKFTELYNVQHLQSNQLDSVSRVCISTIQRLYSLLKGETELPSDADEMSGFAVAEALFKEPVPVEYNSAIPIETFDVIIVDECHRSIYNLWRQVLEYFDAFLIGLTATPSKETFGYFKQNLVMEYSHEEAVADGVNVNYDVYRILTQITERGSKVEAGFYVDKRHRLTRKIRWEKLEDDLLYDASQLDREVVAPDQIRTVIRTFRDKLFSEIFPGRTDVPKTLIYAKDDSHADDIVEIVRQEFGKGNDFCQKITYKTTGVKTEDLIASFRNSYNPRIAVTVDMIATGTDIKPLEIVLFMRSVKSRTFFEQMKGRGVRVIPETDFQAVTPDARNKTHFVIIDAVGVCDCDRTDSRPLERKRHVPFEKLLEAVALGNRQEDVITSLAGRLARLERQLDRKEEAEVKMLLGGQSLQTVVHTLVSALDPDRAEDNAKASFNTSEPSQKQIEEAKKRLLDAAVQPIAANPGFRNRLVELQKAKEQTIDIVSKDQVISAGFDQAALEAARNTIKSFEQFLHQHKDEITALQILYSRPHRSRLTFAQIKELAEAIEKPPRRWTTETLWHAYETLEKSRVRGTGQHLLTDLVSLVRFALHEEETLVPFAEKVEDRFQGWLSQQAVLGRQFTSAQQEFLELIRDHIATSLSMEVEDFEYAPFNQKGGLGKADQLFGAALPKVLEELNEALAA